MSEEKTKPTCSQCKWWNTMKEVMGEPLQIAKTAFPKDLTTVTGGRCQRYAPRGEFPITREDDWCGEFHPIDNDITKWI